MTRTTGSERARDRAAELARPPSYRPMTPSMTATSIPSIFRKKEEQQKDGPAICRSRFRETLPVTMVWRVGSIKSGPHLKGCTLRPRCLRAARIPRVMVVLPDPLVVPPMRNAEILVIYPSRIALLKRSSRAVKRRAPICMILPVITMSSALTSRVFSPMVGLWVSLPK